MTDETFGARLKARRKALRWSLDELARRVDRSKSFLSELERDLRRPGGDTLMALASALGTSMDALLTGGPNGQAGPDDKLAVAVEIPADLAALARTADLSYRRTVLLLQLGKIVRQSRGKGLGGFDWPKFHEAIKEWL